jgi:hypothetical protein
VYTIVVTPDCFSPTSSTYVTVKTPENTEQNQSDPEPTVVGGNPNGILL